MNFSKYRVPGDKKCDFNILILFFGNMLKQKVFKDNLATSLVSGGYLDQK